MSRIWSMDFLVDDLFAGRKRHLLTVQGFYTRECLAIEVGQSLKGEDFVQVLKSSTATGGLPQLTQTDNAIEFIGNVLEKCAYERRVELVCSRPGKPNDVANVESFSGRLRQGCLNTDRFLLLDDAQNKIRALRRYDSVSRPRSALNWQTPAEFARQCWASPPLAISKEPESSTSGWYRSCGKSTQIKCNHVESVL